MTLKLQITATINSPFAIDISRIKVFVDSRQKYGETIFSQKVTFYLPEEFNQG